ncbi:MAG: hypothetical protein WC842_03625 [Candidatus Paceibacterota bacterium]|jgi:hypothetical protein
MEQFLNIAKNSEYLKKFEPLYVGSGADNIVFKIKASEKKFVKVSRDMLERQIDCIVSGGNINEQIEGQKKRIQEFKEKQNKIIDVFGIDHVLRSDFIRHKIELTKNEASEIVGKEINGKEEKYQIDTFIQTQPIAKELRDKEKYQTKSFNTALMREVDFGKGGERDVIINNGIPAAQKFVSEFPRGFINELKTKKVSEEYIPVYKEILEKMIAYTKKTGSMIDIFGPENITVFKDENGKVGYHLIDPILPGKTEHFEKPFIERNMNGLRHGCIYYYSLRDGAKLLGIEDSIQLEDLNYFKGIDEETKKKIEQ